MIIVEKNVRLLVNFKIDCSNVIFLKIDLS